MLKSDVIGMIVMVLIFAGMSALFFYEGFKARKELKACQAKRAAGH